MRGSRITLTLCTLAALVAPAGCGRARTREARGAPPAASTVRRELLVRPESLAARLRGAAPPLVIAVADDSAAYGAGHVPGARFLAIGRILATRDGIPAELPPVARLDSVFESLGVSDSTTVVVYGAGPMAARVFFTLDYLGHGDRVALLDGGLAGWARAGGPLSTEAPAPARGTLTPRPRPELLVDMAWVRAHHRDSGVVLIDARPAADYAGHDSAHVTAHDTTGHILGARSLPWEETLVSSEDAVLKQPGQLKRMLAVAHVGERDTLVVYCHSGMRASWLYFVARYLGRPVKLYDGSWAEWRRDASAPVGRGRTPGGG